MFVEDNIVTMVDDTIKDLDKIEEKWYNVYGSKYFQVALFLYGRYGELPAELMHEKVLENISKFIDKQETLFNENIDFYVSEYFD